MDDPLFVVIHINLDAVQVGLAFLVFTGIDLIEVAGFTLSGASRKKKWFKELCICVTSFTFMTPQWQTLIY